MKKALATIIGILVAGAVGLLAVSNRNVSNQPVSPERQRGELGNEAQSQKAPDFALQNYDGQTVHLADFAGKPLVINSWAAWCPFCRKELVDFATIQKELGDKVAIIAVDRAESRDVAKKYTDELGVTNNLVFLLDPSDNFYQSIGGFSMPETIFVNAGGDIVFHKRGSMNVEEMRAKIKELFNFE